ncbi:MAG: ThiF family adenylyltransferase, partial [Phycisphaerae bacterium]
MGGLSDTSATHHQGTKASDEALARYARQMLFAGVGREGQEKLLAARVLLVGCGALGTVVADTLVRAGVGLLRICDRDFIELNNLQRQVLFDEHDVAAQLPKAIAAADKLGRINSTISVEPRVVDVNHANIESLAEGMDLLLDGTDNFETRYLINDLAVKTNRPWVYGAAVGATGLCLTIVPGTTPCLRCVFESAPPPEMNPTCDTAGVLAMTVNLVAAFQAVEAIKLLTGQQDQINRKLMHIDAWTPRIVGMDVQAAIETSCPCCQQRQFPYLAGQNASSSLTLCGRNAVQVRPPRPARINLAAMARKLQDASEAAPTSNKHLLQARLDGLDVTLFADGRAIIKGTDDIARAVLSVLAMDLTGCLESKLPSFPEYESPTRSDGTAEGSLNTV